MVERDSNMILLNPVTDRRETTLLPLIQRHVAKRSTIYSDGWSAYCNLNGAGYRHFTVLQKYTFLKEYKNTQTGAVEIVHTQRTHGSTQKTISGKIFYNYSLSPFITQILFKNYSISIIYYSCI